MPRARKKPTRPVEVEFIVIPADDDELARFIDGCSYSRIRLITDGDVLIKQGARLSIVSGDVFDKTYDIINESWNGGLDASAYAHLFEGEIDLSMPPGSPSEGER